MVKHDPLKTWIDGLPQESLECRELGHLWQPWRATFDGKAYDRTLRCPRCETERHQVLNRRGHVLSNRYAYADGYLTKGVGRLDPDGRDAVRLASMLRGLPPTRTVEAA